MLATLLLATLLLAAVCTPLPTCVEAAAAVPAVVQHAGKDAGVTTTTTLQFPSANAAGNFIGVAIRAGNHSVHALTVTDSNRNVYTRALQLEPALDTISLALYYARNISAGINTITVSDATVAGTLRIAIMEVSGVNDRSLPSTSAEGSWGTPVSSLPGLPGDFIVTAVTAANPVAFAPMDGGSIVQVVSNKLLLESGSASASISPIEPWAVISAAFTRSGTQGACATPTPVVTWNQNAELDLAGYSLYYREPGGVFQKLLDFPCAWYDLDDDNVTETRFCRGPDLGTPLQRYCPSCLPLNAYEFAVKAYDLGGDASVAFSNIVSVCFSPICGRPGPCN